MPLDKKDLEMDGVDAASFAINQLTNELDGEECDAALIYAAIELLDNVQHKNARRVIPIMQALSRLV